MCKGRLRGKSQSDTFCLEGRREVAQPCMQLIFLPFVCTSALGSHARPSFSYGKIGDRFVSRDRELSLLGACRPCLVFRRGKNIGVGRIHAQPDLRPLRTEFSIHRRQKGNLRHTVMHRRSSGERCHSQTNNLMSRSEVNHLTTPPPDDYPRGWAQSSTGFRSERTGGMIYYDSE